MPGPEARRPLEHRRHLREQAPALAGGRQVPDRDPRVDPGRRPRRPLARLEPRAARDVDRRRPGSRRAGPWRRAAVHRHVERGRTLAGPRTGPPRRRAAARVRRPDLGPDRRRPDGPEPQPQPPVPPGISSAVDAQLAGPARRGRPGRRSPRCSCRSGSRAGGRARRAGSRTAPPGDRDHDRPHAARSVARQGRRRCLSAAPPPPPRHALDVGRRSCPPTAAGAPGGPPRASVCGSSPCARPNRRPAGERVQGHVVEVRAGCPRPQRADELVAPRAVARAAGSRCGRCAPSPPRSAAAARARRARAPRTPRGRRSQIASRAAVISASRSSWAEQQRGRHVAHEVGGAEVDPRVLVDLAADEPRAVGALLLQDLGPLDQRSSLISSAPPSPHDTFLVSWKLRVPSAPRRPERAPLQRGADALRRVLDRP